MTTPAAHPTPCPHCGRVNDRHERTPGQQPTPGDVGVCWGCGGLAVFTDDLGQRLPTREEMAEIKRSPELARIRAAMPAARDPRSALDVLWGSS